MDSNDSRRQVSFKAWKVTEVRRQKASVWKSRPFAVQGAAVPHAGIHTHLVHARVKFRSYVPVQEANKQGFGWQWTISQSGKIFHSTYYNATVPQYHSTGVGTSLPSPLALAQ